MQINIKKKYLYIFLSITILLFSSLYVIAQTFTTPAWDSSKQSHDVLYTDIITSKSTISPNRKVDFEADLDAKGGIILGGVRKTSWPSGGAGGRAWVIIPPNIPTPPPTAADPSVPGNFAPVRGYVIALPGTSINCVSKCNLVRSCPSLFSWIDILDPNPVPTTINNPWCELTCDTTPGLCATPGYVESTTTGVTFSQIMYCTPP